jgi:hypothetical protein
MWAHGIMVVKLEMHELYCLNYGKGVYELEDPIGEEAQGSNLPPKLGLAKKLFLQVFPIAY